MFNVHDEIAKQILLDSLSTRITLTCSNSKMFTEFHAGTASTEDRIYRF